MGSGRGAEPGASPAAGPAAAAVATGASYSGRGAGPRPGPMRLRQSDAPDAPAVRRSRLFSTVFSPIPRTCVSSSTEENAPCSSR